MSRRSRIICIKKGHKWSSHLIGKFCLRCRMSKAYWLTIKHLHDEAVVAKQHAK